MPKLKESPAQRMERVFRAVVTYGLERRGENIEDLAKYAPKSRSTVYHRMRTPLNCTMEEMLFYGPKFFNDRQLCEMIGVEYHGVTAAEARAPLSSAAKVTERLIGQYGPAMVWQIERCGENIFQARLRDGRVVMAVALADGSLDVKEMEGTA